MHQCIIPRQLGSVLLVSIQDIFGEISIALGTLTIHFKIKEVVTKGAVSQFYILIPFEAFCYRFLIPLIITHSNDVWTGVGLLLRFLQLIIVIFYYQ